MATKSTARKRAGRGTTSKKTVAKKASTGSKASKKKAGSTPKTSPAKSTKAKSGKNTGVTKKASAAAKKSVARKKTAKKAVRKATRAPSRSADAKKRSGDRRQPRPVRPSGVRKKYKHLGDILLEKQAELIQAYASAKTDTRDRMDDGTEDYIDYAVNSYAKDFMLSLTEMERQQLQLVQEALRRLDRDEYGECLQCGVEIPMKRLEVAPWVRYCIECQELEDQGLLPQQPFVGFDEDDDSELEEEADSGEKDEVDEDEGDDDDSNSSDEDSAAGPSDLLDDDDDED